jgi:hypothetical protein
VSFKSVDTLNFNRYKTHNDLIDSKYKRQNDQGRQRKSNSAVH